MMRIWGEIIMLCLKCVKIITDVDNLLIEFDPEEYGLCENIKESLICERCNSDILIGDYYFEDESETEEIESELCYKIGKAVQKNISSCPNCGHGSDMKDLQASLYIHFKEDDEWEDMYDDYHIYTELQGLIADNSLVDDDYYDEIIDNIRCPQCGNGGGAYSKDTMYDEKFDRWTEVYTKRDVELFDENFYGEVYKSIKDYVELIGSKIKIEKLEEFRNKYVLNPIFITQEDMFKVLYDKLNEVFNKGPNITLYKSKRLYRTRPNENGNSLFDKTELWNPPMVLANQGRYNTHGKSVLYCSNNIDILTKEVPIPADKEYNFATLRLLKPMKMLPIDIIFSDFEGFINDNSVEDSVMKKKYILTNIIQLICERIGYNGVAYKSVKDSRYVNYAFFNFEKNQDIEILNVFK